MSICKACNGKGYFTGCVYESDEVGFVDKDYECVVCHGTGQIEQTHEEWFCQLPTEEKAEWLVEFGIRFLPVEIRTISPQKLKMYEENVLNWLKEKNDEM